MKYEENWKEDKEDGAGKESLSVCASYEGDYKQSKKSCKGKDKWADGNSYEGNSIDISKNDQIKELKNIKSDFILKKIINFMKRNKLLEILKYNKKLQKRLNININDYRECAKIEIEIELNPDDRKKGSKRKFINIPDKDKEFYHIYFDNSNKEIKRNYLKDYDEVKKIKIIIDYPVESFEFLFAYSKCINSIFFKKFTRNNIINMSNMFYKCSALKELNLSNFKTKKETNVEGMFLGCSNELIAKIKKQIKNINIE